MADLTAAQVRRIVREAVNAEVQPLDERLAVIEQIERDQLVEIEERSERSAARQKLFVSGLRAVSSGIVRGCDRMSMTVADTKVMLGLIVIVIIYLAGSFALQISYGDEGLKISNGSSTPTEAPAADRMTPEPLP